MVQWHTLSDTQEGGVYVRACPRVVLPEDSAMCLLEGLLRYEGRALVVGQATHHPVLFPFDLELRIGAVRRSSRFEIFRQGVDTDLVWLAGA